MPVTNAETEIWVFHLGLTLLRSITKKPVVAANEIEMIQNDIPT